MNTEIGREIKKKKFYSNKNLSQRRAIHNRMHKRYAFEIYIYIYVEQINERIVRGSYDLMVK